MIYYLRCTFLIKGVHGGKFLIKGVRTKRIGEQKVSHVQRTPQKCTPKSIKTYTEAYTIKNDNLKIFPNIILICKHGKDFTYSDSPNLPPCRGRESMQAVFIQYAQAH